MKKSKNETHQTALEVEILLGSMLTETKINKLRQRIDETLIKGDKESFMSLTTELRMLLN